MGKTVTGDDRTRISGVFSLLSLYLRRRVIAELAMLADLYTCRFRFREPCVVFQMGKVGSTTIVSALNATGKIRAFQAHRLNPENTADIQARFRAGEGYYRDMIFERGLYRWLQRQRRPVKVIVPLREPFSHSYSSFFQNIRRNTRGHVDPRRVEIEVLAPYFFRWEELGMATKWIEREYIPVLGYDPYRYDFDSKSGTQVIAEGRYEVLLLKVELDDNAKARAIADFLGLGAIELKRRNVAEGKAYATLYNRFRSEVRIPSVIANSWTKSRYMHHFYTKTEIKNALVRFAEK